MSALTLPRLMGLFLTTAALSAQSPLTTTYANNNGNANGGMVFFDLDVTDPAGIQIHAMDINTSASTGGISVWTVPTTWVGSESNAGAWSLQAAGSFSAGAGAGSPTPICFGAGFFLPQGQYGVAIEQSATTNMNYTTGTAPFALTYSTSELTLTAGAGNNVPFAGAPFSPRVVNASIYYNVGAVPGACVVPGATVSYGVGCNMSFASFYEAMDTASFDLSNTNISATNTGAGYVVQTSPGTGILPTGAIGSPTTLTMPDDGQVPAGTLGVVVGSNGWVATGSGNSNGFAPSAATMLNNPTQAVYTWTDLQPDISGIVSYEENPATGATRTTFDGVNGWNTTDPHFIQIDFNTLTGDWAVRFGAVGFANPEDWLIGYSPSGVSGDPGSMDISAAGTFTTQGSDELPLTTSGSAPSLGTNWDVTTTNIDPLSPIAITFFGDRGPAVPLSLIGFNAPGCDINLGAVFSDMTSGNVGGSSVVSVPIPNFPALAGYQLSAQSVCLTLTNPAGLLTSTASETTIGGQILQGFVDLDYTARTVNVASSLGPTQAVVLNGLATVNPVGAINGSIQAAFAGGATATASFQGDNVVVTSGSTTVDMNMQGAPDMFLVNGVPTPIANVYATFHSDSAAGGQPSAWSETSRAVLAVKAIIETVEMIENFGWAKWLVPQQVKDLLCKLAVNYAADVIIAHAQGALCNNIGAACTRINAALAPWVTINCTLIVNECNSLVSLAVNEVKDWIKPLIWG